MENFSLCYSNNLSMWIYFSENLITDQVFPMQIWQGELRYATRVEYTPGFKDLKRTSQKGGLKMADY